MSGFDDYKHVMLSEPPQRFANNTSNSYGASAAVTNGFSSGAFENYKGVLLCERPSHLTGSQGVDRPFLPPGQTGNYAGLPPSVEEQKRHHIAKRLLAHKKMPCPAQIQYRKLLKEMSNKRENERTQAEMEALEAQRVIECKKSKRAAEKPVAAMHHDLARTPSELESQYSDEIAPVEEVAPKPLDRRKPQAEKEKDKPRWGMTADESDAADEKAAERLLKYVGKLDIEKYMNDFEVKEALSIIQERIAELEENEKEKASVTDSVLTDRKNYGDNPFLSRPDEPIISYTQDGAPPRPPTYQEDVQLPSLPIEPGALNALTLPAVPNPIVAHSPDVAPKRILLQLKNSKDYVQNLPYMYRCPSI